MDDKSLFGRSPGAGAEARRHGRYAPLDSRGTPDQSFLHFQVEEAATRDRKPEARQDERSQEADPIRRQCRLVAPAHPIRFVHIAEADGGNGGTVHQDRPARVFGFDSRLWLEFQKKQIGPPSKIGPTSPAGGSAGRRIRVGSTLRGWSLLTRHGSKPTWRRCVAGDQEASVFKQWCPMVTGRP